MSATFREGDWVIYRAYPTAQAEDGEVARVTPGGLLWVRWLDGQQAGVAGHGPAAAYSPTVAEAEAIARRAVMDIEWKQIQDFTDMEDWA